MRNLDGAGLDLGDTLQTFYMRKSVSVTELKRNFSSVLSQAEEAPVAVLKRNKPVAHLLSAAHYERLLERLEDLEDARLVWERSGGPFVEVGIDELEGRPIAQDDVGRRPVGLAAGEFVVPDSFDDPLPAEVLRGFCADEGGDADASGKGGGDGG